MRNIFQKYDPLKTRNRYSIREGGRSLDFHSTEEIRGILYIRDGVPSTYITNLKESQMKYDEEDKLWIGKQKIQVKIYDVKQGGDSDIIVPLQTYIIKIEDEGEREVKTLYKNEKQPVDKFVNGLKLFGSQAEYLEKLNEVEKARLENISIFEIRDTLLTALAKTPRKWSNYLNAVQHIYNNLDHNDFNRTKTVKVPYDWVTNHLINASISLEVNGYNFFLTDGGVMDCGGIDVKSYLFDVPQAEIITNYIKEVLI